MTSLPSVLQVHSYYQRALPSGESITFEAEVALLRARGHRVLTYVRRAEEIGPGVSAHAATAVDAIWARRSHSELRALLRRERPDLVHFHNTFPLVSASAYAACRDEGIPIVQTLHNYRLICAAGVLFRDGRPCHDCVDRVPWRAITRACYRDGHAASAAMVAAVASHRLSGIRRGLVDLYVSPSEFARAMLVRGGIPHDRIVTKPHFVDPDPGLGNSAREGAIFIGRLSSEKGVAALIRAWDLLSRPVALRIVGDGELAPEVARLVAKNPAIRWDRHLPQTEIFRALKASRLLLFPSQSEETFGRSIIESFATGTPVVVVGRGAPAEIVEHERTGLVVSAGDDAALAAAVERIAAGGDEPAVMGRTARRVFEERYSGDSGYRALLDVYRKVVGTKAEPAPSRESVELSDSL